MSNPRTPIFNAIRTVRGKGFTQPEVDSVDACLDGLGVPRQSLSAEPAWLTTARSLLGESEIPGSRHNSKIVAFWKTIGAGWFNSDETPWCGAFVGHCMKSAGLPVPAKGEGARAASWASYGVACAPQVGAIGVKKRNGGGHVFFIVGQTPDKRFYKALGGNQGNCVSVIDILKTDTYATRWPAGVPTSNIPLPVLRKGQTGVSEA